MNSDVSGNYLPADGAEGSRLVPPLGKLWLSGGTGGAAWLYDQGHVARSKAICSPLSQEEISWYSELFFFFCFQT